MADQPINGLPKKTAAADTDALLMIGASEEYQIDYGKLADAILNKLTNKTFALDQGSKSLVAALNELNSKTNNRMIISSGTDLNTIVKVGLYSVNNPKNAPVGCAAGWSNIIVLQAGGNIEFPTQILIHHDISTEINIYVRIAQQSNFTKWYKFSPDK